MSAVEDANVDEASVKFAFVAESAVEDAYVVVPYDAVNASGKVTRDGRESVTDPVLADAVI